MLKNAIDYLYAEWNNKAVGFVSYGAVGGARAAEHLRLIAGELQMADVRPTSRSRCSPTSRTSPCSSPAAHQAERSTRCSTRSSPGAEALAPLRQVTQAA